MSYQRKCGCVIADSKDTSVRKGYEVGGYVKEWCSTHDPKERIGVLVKANDKGRARARKMGKQLAKETIEALRPVEDAEIIIEIADWREAADLAEKEDRRSAAIEYRKTADLIERLARENEQLSIQGMKNTAVQLSDGEEIDRLQSQLAEAKERIEKQDELIEEQRSRLAALLEGVGDETSSGVLLMIARLENERDELKERLSIYEGGITKETFDIIESLQAQIAEYDRVLESASKKGRGWVWLQIHLTRIRQMGDK